MPKVVIFWRSIVIWQRNLFMVWRGSCILKGSSTTIAWSLSATRASSTLNATKFMLHSSVFIFLNYSNPQQRTTSKIHSKLQNSLLTCSIFIIDAPVLNKRQTNKSLYQAVASLYPFYTNTTNTTYTTKFTKDSCGPNLLLLWPLFNL